LIESQNQPNSRDYHRWLTPGQFGERFGPSQATIASVTAALEAQGFTVASHTGQKLHVTATAGKIESAFGVRLLHAGGLGAGQALVADRPLVLPGVLAASGAVMPQFATVPPFDHNVATANGHSPTGRYTTADLRQAYDYPSAEALTARGVHIGILMDGAVNDSDLAGYWMAAGLPDALKPSVATILVNGGRATATKEATLDIQQSGGMSLAASIHLYSIPDLTHANIMAGLNHIIEDNVADVVNMSFSGAEADYAPAANQGISQTALANMEHQLFQQGTAQGITFVGSSGDHGAIPIVGGQPTRSVEYPASDPYVVGVGGTNLVTAYKPGSNNSAYVSENANHDFLPNGEVWGSGGGISVIQRRCLTTS
jgi:subtilase family serine protease